MVWAGVFSLLLLILCIGFCYYRFLHRTRQPNEPPLDRGSIPWLGYALEFGKDAAKFLSDMKEKHGDIFTIQVAGKFITVLLDPHSYDAVFWAPSNQLDFGKYARMLMDRMFDVRLPPSGGNEEKTLLALHFQGSNLTKLTRSMFHNLSTILLKDRRLPNTEWTDQGLFDFIYGVMLRAGYLTLFGTESEQYTSTYSPMRDLKHSEDVYKEFRKLDWLLMKAARNTLSTGEKEEASLVKNRLQKLISIKSHKGKCCKSSWFEYYQQHLEEIQATEDMQSRALVLQLWATQGNAGPATFWLVLYLLKHPEAMAAVQAEFESIFQRNLQEKRHIEEMNQDLLDKMIILDNVLNETLRLTAAPFISREVLTDMTLKLADGHQYQLRRGDRLCLFPFVSPQMDPEVHQQPEVFQHNRFLNADGTEKTEFYKKGKRLKYYNLPWGAGSNVCVGKKHAVNSIKQFVCLLLFYFDFELKTPAEKIPEFNRTRYGFGLLQPEHDILFRYRRKA
ncbi:hypothetical protein XENTR_v10004171 [Xenopus tropicalis]|uniref:Prostacyclin synthase n=2 Tax=Xenopus tropicalis TaxID=8364 RepID=A0A6I8RA65_XENTR|nr:prostacyclin synthase isoform X1 [Xenopus tropicalis]KAE8576413.1 hypothetical protein XENTR_v10004171 [Xenopus tropicalis]